MANRVYYSSQGVAVGLTTGTYSTVEGGQSVGISANFSLEQAFQMGRVAIYDNIMTDGEVTITCSKILDGNDTIYKLATGADGLSPIVNQSETKFKVRVASNTNEGASELDASNQLGSEVTGCFLSSVAYTVPSDGFATEEVSFVGDNKAVGASKSVAAPTGSTTRATYRQMFDQNGSNLPIEVSGLNVTNVSINADFGREAMFKLGQFRPFHRYANFPFEVGCEITVSNVSTDQSTINLGGVTATSDGSLPGKQNIVIKLTNAEGFTGSHGYEFHVSGARLNTLSQDGGDTGGGNATTTLGYQTFNELSISG